MVKMKTEITTAQSEENHDSHNRDKSVSVCAIDEDEAANNINVLGDDVKQLLQAVNNLTHHGIDTIANISIPKIAIIGDQSAGKSSLVEALSEIQVPRDAGTCTRCPMEITLSDKNPGVEWEAVVSLSTPYIFDPGNTEIGQHVFHPWVHHNQGTTAPIYFQTVTTKSE